MEHYKLIVFAHNGRSLIVGGSMGFSAFFKEFSLGGGGGGQNRKKRQDEKYEPSRFGERTSLKRDFVKL